MAGLDRTAAPPPVDDGGPAAVKRAQYGLVLFAVYLLLYGGFMALSAFAPALMEQTPLAGVNLAVLYGLGLIAAAFLLALVYEALCREGDSPANGETTR